MLDRTHLPETVVDVQKGKTKEKIRSLNFLAMRVLKLLSITDLSKWMGAENSNPVLDAINEAYQRGRADAAAELSEKPHA